MDQMIFQPIPIIDSAVGRFIEEQLYSFEETPSSTQFR
jgi:hypothetical protein